MNLYDYRLMEKLITIAKINNELDTVRERLEARSWWDDGFKALFDMVLKDLEKKQLPGIDDVDLVVDNSISFRDSQVIETVDKRATKVKINRYVRSCLRIIDDHLRERGENVEIKGYEVTDE